MPAPDGLPLRLPCVLGDGTAADHGVAVMREGAEIIVPLYPRHYAVAEEAGVFAGRRIVGFYVRGQVLVTRPRI